MPLRLPATRQNRQAQTPTPSRPPQQQPVQRELFRLQRVELDLREPPLGNLSPHINVRIRLLPFAAIQASKEAPGGVARSHLPQRRPRQSFHHITAQEFIPVVIEK